MTGRIRVLMLVAGLAVKVGVFAQAAPPAAPAPAKSITATEKDDRGKLILAAGGTLTVRLQSNVTTGYGWSVVKNDPKALKLMGKPKYESPKQVIPGAGGHQVFSFQATGAIGTNTVLVLEYKRPWEKDTPPAQTLTLNVRIAK